MEYILRKFNHVGVFGWLYVISLFFGFSYFGVHYINSSYLERHLSQSDVGLLFAISSALSVLVLGTITFILRRIGNYYVALTAAGGSIAALLGLSYTEDIGLTFVCFTLFTVLSQTTLFTFDVFLESNTKDENTTGSVRGIFLSMGLLAALFSPAIAGFLAGDTAMYEYAYLASAIYIIPVLLILVLRFRTFTDPPYHVLSIPRTVRTLWHNRNLLHISVAQFLLRFFFSWYVVYLPVYLHRNIGFSWPEIGIVLFAMLVPYVLIEYPAGRLADKYWGEKEMLVAGFLIASFTTALVFWTRTDSILIWSAVLMATRVGAALIESMTETYFFKQIDGADASILSTFRILHPLAYAIGPLVAGILLLHVSLEYLWLILSGVLLFGVIHALVLTDTK